MRNKLSTINAEIINYLENYDGTITHITFVNGDTNGTERTKYQKFISEVMPGYIHINYNVQPEEWTYLLKNLYILNDFNMNYNFDGCIEYITGDDSYAMCIKNIEPIS